ncbi:MULTISPECIES: GH39 family glycosyl hydrolase [unclassified Inquilinus]|uniref:GH39 family glycosyl hydrolase n=1 Tax=unclassified Inquilinus TaxID=2645927 RepID=UPI003F8F8233
MVSSFAVGIDVRSDRPTGPYRPLWNWFGYDEPNFTYTDNGRKLLRELAELSPEPIRVRTHNLLTTGDGTPALKWGSTNAYTEGPDGKPVYDWTIMDRIFDAYVEAGAIPLVQIGFTPQALSSDPGPYQHSWVPEDRYASITTGWASPPNDLKKWGDLVEAWARHLADRYGEDVVSGWPWEVWNEPDGHYWTGTIPEFCAMYDVSARAVKRALPNARVGGPHTCGAFGNEKAITFLRGFLKHVVENDSPIDFIAFHAKGNPVIYRDHVRMGAHKHLRDIDTNLSIINEFPSLKGLPVVIGESDPEGCAACSARVHPQNGYRNGPLYSVYVVETMLRTYELSQRAGIPIEGAVTWAFLFEDQPYFDGFRDLATNGIDKAVMNAFRMLGMLGGDWLATTSTHAVGIEHVMAHGVRETPHVNAVATRDEGGVSVLVWHYHDDDEAGPTAEVTLSVVGVPSGAAIRHYRIDADHSNAFGVWQAMGAPQTLTGAEYERLEAAGRLQRVDEAVAADRSGDGLTLRLALPRQGVSLIRIEA